MSSSNSACLRGFGVAICLSMVAFTAFQYGSSNHIETKDSAMIVALLTKNAGNPELFGEEIEFRKEK